MIRFKYLNKFGSSIELKLAAPYLVYKKGYESPDSSIQLNPFKICYKRLNAKRITILH